MIKISRSELDRGLKLAAGVADKSNNASPMLANVLLRAKDDKLTISATDLNVSLTAEMACEVQVPFSIALDAADLRRFVAGAADDSVQIWTTDKHWAEIRCGRSRYRIAGHSDRDFPRIPKAAGDGVPCDAAVLRELLERTGYAASTDETRTNICGVCLHVESEQVQAVATDGHRFTRMVGKLKLPRPQNGKAIVSTPGVDAIVRLLKLSTACAVAIDAKHMHVTADGITVSTALVDVDYPNFDHVIASIKHKICVIVNRDRLIEVLKRIAPLASDLRGVAITTRKDSLVFDAHNPDGEEIGDEIGAECDGELRIGVHPKYVIDCLQHMTSDTIMLRLSGELDPLTFIDDDRIGVIMPMRL